MKEMLFYAVQDENEMYVDERCIFFDKATKQFSYKSYKTFYNTVLLNTTYQKATEMCNIISEKCLEANYIHTFKIVDVQL